MSIGDVFIGSCDDCVCVESACDDRECDDRDCMYAHLVVAYMGPPQLHPLLVDVRPSAVAGSHADLALEVVGDTDLVKTPNESKRVLFH